jgi:tRNA (guanine-N7-)-methyltransferase
MSSKLLSAQEENHCFSEKFQYSHNNPYHERIQRFSDRVLCDESSEAFANHWRSKVFENEAPIHLEIGSGYGHFLKQFCSTYPDQNFVGMDFRFKRSFNLNKQLNALNIPHYRFLRARAERISFIFGKEEVQNIFCFFPDPWPKTRHHKKRLIQVPFLERCHDILENSGKIFLKTDHLEYYFWMCQNIELFNQSQKHHKRFLVHFMVEELSKKLDEASLSTFDHTVFNFKTKFERLFHSQNIRTKAILLEKA